MGHVIVMYGWGQGKNDTRFYKESLLRLKAEIKDGEATRQQEQQRLQALQQEMRKFKDGEQVMQEKVSPQAGKACTYNPTTANG